MLNFPSSSEVFAANESGRSTQGRGRKEGRIWSMESRRGEAVCGIRGLIYFHNVQSWATPLADTVGIGQGFRTSPVRFVLKHAKKSECGSTGPKDLSAALLPLARTANSERFNLGH